MASQISSSGCFSARRYIAKWLTKRKSTFFMISSKYMPTDFSLSLIIPSCSLWDGRSWVQPKQLVCIISGSNFTLSITTNISLQYPWNIFRIVSLFILSYLFNIRTKFCSSSTSWRCLHCFFSKEVQIMYVKTTQPRKGTI